MQRGLVWSVAASLVGLATMAIVATVVQPPRVQLADLSHHVGQSVRIDGWVLDPRTSASGWTRFLLSDGNDSVAVQSAESPILTAGDRVECDGLVEQAASKIQVRLESKDAARIVQPWREHHVPLDALALSPWSLVGAQFVTSGTIAHVGGQVRLLDPDGRNYFRTSGLDDAPDGAFLLVDARLDYEEASTSFRLIVTGTEAA